MPKMKGKGLPIEPGMQGGQPAYLKAEPGSITGAAECQHEVAICFLALIPLLVPQRPPDFVPKHDQSLLRCRQIRCLPHTHTPTHFASYIVGQSWPHQISLNVAAVCPSDNSKSTSLFLR